MTRDVDLNGLGVAHGGSGATYDSLDCVPASAGSFLIFGQSTDPLANAGLPRVDLLFGFTLTNNSTAGARLTLSRGTTPLDEVGWTTSSTGRSRTVRASAASAGGNDDPASWCLSASTYGDGTNRGSPGTLDPACP